MSALARAIPPVAEMSDEALIQEVITRSVGYRLTSDSRRLAPVLNELRRRLCQSWAMQDQIVLDRDDAAFIWLYFETTRPEIYPEWQRVIARIEHALGVDHPPP